MHTQHDAILFGVRQPSLSSVCSMLLRSKNKGEGKAMIVVVKCLLR